MNKDIVDSLDIRYCPKCKHDTLQQKVNITEERSIGFVCLNCGRRFQIVSSIKECPYPRLVGLGGD